MIIPELRHIISPDCDPPKLPPDPTDCVVYCQALIGPKDDQGQEAFGFYVVTPKHLAGQTDLGWARGFLIVPILDWTIVQHHLERLLATAARPTWREVGEELNKTLFWEFDNYVDAAEA